MKTIKHLQQLAKEGFTDWSSLGDIEAQEQDGLIILSYRHPSDWNDYERVCRGLILSRNGDVVALPFEKFFNWFEGGRHGTGHIVNVTEKLDGSLGILYRKDGELRIATRGKFDSEQALKATQLLHEKFNLKDATALPDNLTLLFEIIYPDNRIVVDYGQREDLVLLAVRDRYTGEYQKFFPDLYNFAFKYGFSLPSTYAFNSAVDIVEKCGALGPNEEGYVAQLSDGTFWKFKGDRYQELHAVVTANSPRRLREAYLNGSLKEMLIDLGKGPAYDKLLAAFMGMANSIGVVRSTVEFLMISAPDPHVDRKAFAEFAKNFPAYTEYLFAHVDNKLTDENILRRSAI